MCNKLVWFFCTTTQFGVWRTHFLPQQQANVLFQRALTMYCWSKCDFQKPPPTRWFWAIIYWQYVKGMLPLLFINTWQRKHLVLSTSSIHTHTKKNYLVLSNSTTAFQSIGLLISEDSKLKGYNWFKFFEDWKEYSLKGENLCVLFKLLRPSLIIERQREESGWGGL